MTAQKVFHLQSVFLGKYRTGDVEQFTTSGEDLPKDVEDLPLFRGKSGKVAFPPQPFYVRMTARHPGSRAGDIPQNAVELSAVPPCFRLRCVAMNDAICFKAQPGKILFYARYSRDVIIDCG